MSVYKRPSRALILGGLFFVIPLIIFIFLINNAIHLLLPIGRKLIDLLNIHTIFGAATLTIVSVLLLLGLCYISGLLLEMGVVHQWSQKMEERLFTIFPSLQMLKYRLLDEEQDLTKDHWKAILLKEDQSYILAFITNETENGFLSLYIPDAPKMDAGEIRYLNKENCEFISIPMQNAMKALNTFGRDGELPSHIKK
ncbi:Uncharacterized membrane protein [Zhouia amylolytica]|uniref:DUF502 domain-containing protein n=2 Tax=Zhouia amylolytica TaxID=376730 RepID=W2UJQ4_9FLAO|nr:hypothetical protein [Zhouia amylolytica]ETN94199.1 hypothetical protein P278_30030 [Zhouia amylolytica AD3]MCQ0111503.1 hypothetical protein [Zhouia amylolytica]SFS39962.1 Uncharacterized membrane protein [Zhouia amylolytica]